MRQLFTRILPDGLAARFALLLACALIAANVVAFAVLSLERNRLGRDAREAQELERLVALVPALEAVSPEIRRRIARDASTRVARVRVASEPVVGTTTSDRRSAALGKRLSEVLGGREVRVAILERGSDRFRERQHHGVVGMMHEMIAISISLGAETDGEWLNLIANGPGPKARGIEQEVFFLILALSMVSVLGVGLISVRSLTRPLTRLAAAARAAGQGDRTARVTPQGAREMREAAQAFNEMQAQIAGFEAERTRTLAAVGHDLRTPITSLRIRAEMLDDEARRPMVRTLDEMAVMANGLVAYARGDGDVEDRERIDMASFLARLCEDRGATLTGFEGVAVSGRPVALARAFGNLIDNAIRYGCAARVDVAREHGKACVRIEDDGPGIPEERLTDMFEPFMRGDDSRSTETGGAGLGLSIARQIIRGHGGTIQLANGTEGGLRVTVLLPLVD